MIDLHAKVMCGIPTGKGQMTITLSASLQGIMIEL